MLPKVNQLGRKSEAAVRSRLSLQSLWLLAVFSRTKGHHPLPCHSSLDFEMEKRTSHHFFLCYCVQKQQGKRGSFQLLKVPSAMAGMLRQPHHTHSLEQRAMNTS